MIDILLKIGIFVTFMLFGVAVWLIRNSKNNKKRYMQSCSVYLRNTPVYIVTTCFDEFRIGCDTNPMFKVKMNTPQEIGETVVTSLNASTRNMPHPKSRDDVRQNQKVLYQFLGVKSWAELAKTSTFASVDRSASGIKVYSHRLCKDGGFEPHGESIDCSITDIEQIGRGVLKALKLDENI